MLERRVDEHIEAYIAMQQAETADYDQAEQLIVEALQKYPELPRARSSLGLWMARDIMRRFVLDHGDPLVWLDAPSLAQIYADTGSMSPFSIRSHLTEMWTNHAPGSRAIYWLRVALDHKDAQNGLVNARPALMLGIERDYEAMISTLRQLKKQYPAQLPTHHSVDSLAMLTDACGNDETRLRALGSVLDHALPQPTARVEKTLSALPLNDPNGNTLEWLIQGKRGKWGDADLACFPALVRFHVTNSTEGRRVRPQLVSPMAFKQPPTILNVLRCL